MSVSEARGKLVFSSVTHIIITFCGLSCTTARYSLCVYVSLVMDPGTRGFGSVSYGLSAIRDRIFFLQYFCHI